MIKRYEMQRAGLFGILCVVGFAVAAETPVRADVPTALQNADPAAVDDWRASINQQLELLSAAYGFDEDGKESLRKEMELRLVLEFEYEAKMNAELETLSKKVTEAGAIGNDDAPEVKELANRLIELNKGMPLNEYQVADWVATRVSPDVAKEGRQRWEELVQRKKQIQSADADEGGRVSGRKAELANEVRDMRSRTPDEVADPMPRGNNGDFARKETIEKMGRPYINPVEMAAARERSQAARANGRSPTPKGAGGYPAPGATPSERMAAAGSPANGAQANGNLPRPPEPRRLNARTDPSGHSAAPPQAAPPLDEWEKYVVSVAQKYGFDAGQNTRAQSILSDLRKRAYQYQLSRSEEYARAQLMTDAKLRTDTLNRLNAPLDALFAELKQRLESLPTMAQKQRQGQPSPNKK